ncbi:hypothetical protein FRZ00_32605 [Streptomyces mobaraensis]|uniref:Uncharacterized protein n=1 Tax=Streptomyces mobaraensis TaxID=35621 RepID=A0A5N5VXU0_STRMB|nr:hypothetical protein FRZ00_32605 [Streptomyces mobaraensis]
MDDGGPGRRVRAVVRRGHRGSLWTGRLPARSVGASRRTAPRWRGPCPPCPTSPSRPTRPPGPTGP